MTSSRAGRVQSPRVRPNPRQRPQQMPKAEHVHSTAPPGDATTTAPLRVGGGAQPAKPDLPSDAAIMKLVDQIFAVNARSDRIYESIEALPLPERLRAMQTQVSPLVRRCWH